MLHSLLAPPGLGDVVSMLTYVLTDPYLFIGSTTVMTTGLVGAAGLLAILAAIGHGSVGRLPDRALAWIAPKLAIALAYFGLGSMILATEILIRFHDVNPEGTEVQFRSGTGHFVVAAIGIALLASRLHGLDLAAWVEAHFWALAYLTVHVLLLTPPWFEFQFQFDLVMGVTRAMLVGALGVNLLAWIRTGRAAALPLRPR